MRITTTNLFAATANTITSVFAGTVNAAKVDVRVVDLHLPRYLSESHLERPQDSRRCSKRGKSQQVCLKASDLTCHSVVANCAALPPTMQMPGSWQPDQSPVSHQGPCGGLRSGGGQS